MTKPPMAAGKEMEVGETDFAIHRIDNHAVMEIGGLSIQISDYKISSSMHGGTKLEITVGNSVVKLGAEDSITEFAMSAKTLPR